MTEEGADGLPPPTRRFGPVADLYDRARPAYAQQMVDDLLAGGPRHIVDVGCGTAKAGRLFVGPSRRVVGVEPDPLMAEVARRYGVEVEVAEFGRWDSGARSFDLLVSGTAWHWVEPVAGAVKAASILRPGEGRTPDRQWAVLLATSGQLTGRPRAASHGRRHCTSPRGDAARGIPALLR